MKFLIRRRPLAVAIAVALLNASCSAKSPPQATDTSVVVSSGPPDSSMASTALTLDRAFLTRPEIPPPGIGAYGIVALRALPTGSTAARLTALCASYMAQFPDQNSIPATIRPQDQMMTIWPVLKKPPPDSPAQTCRHALEDYDLYSGQTALSDAARQGAHVQGEGPYLIGWSPASSRGAKDKLVLVIDMSGMNDDVSINHAFLFWKTKIVENPAAWRGGFSLERFRLATREFVNSYGDEILKAAKLFGLGAG